MTVQGLGNVVLGQTGVYTCTQINKHTHTHFKTKTAQRVGGNKRSIMKTD